MSFSASSFAAGVGGVVVMVGVGFGAGLMMTGVFDEPREPNKLERRLAEATDARSDARTRRRNNRSKSRRTVGQASVQDARPPAQREPRKQYWTNVTLS